jgi:hypothetical protein
MANDGAGPVTRLALPVPSTVSHPFTRRFFNAGGLGVLFVGKLPNPGLEKVFETYYN